jgi:Leucine-rich repeat (LRR) protein
LAFGTLWTTWLSPQANFCHRYFHSTSTTLNSVPDWQGNFKKVQRIDCANNLLARVPPSMGHLKNLKEFSLRYNSLDDRWGRSGWVGEKSSRAH